MSLNTKAIETLSISAVRDSIDLCNSLSHYISENNNEPSWDGAVYIYKDKLHRKENLKGRVSVQVKGKECNDFSNEEILYPMSTADLKNYLYDGGAILFVVYIGSSGMIRKIYFIELTPIKLRLTLSEVKDQKTKTLKLKVFPTDNNKKTEIFLNCLKNFQMQASFTEAKLLSLEELEANGILEGISVPFTVVGEKDFHQALVSSEVYIYANIKGSVIPQPLEFIPMKLTTSVEQDLKISIDDTIFYTKVLKITTAEKTFLRLGESTNITFLDAEKTMTIYYSNSTKARILARDLDFTLKSIEAGYFKINDSTIFINRDRLNLSNFDIDAEKKRLKLSKKVVEALDLLNCMEDIDFKSLNSNDFHNITHIITALVEKKPIENLLPDLPPITKLNIGSLSFFLNLQPCDETKTKYNVYDFFKTEISVVYEDQNGESLPTSQYALLHANDLLSINNVRFDRLLPSFQQIQRHHDKFNEANAFLLELLIAFDKSDSKRAEILKTAQDFAEWILYESTEEELPYNIKTLNYLQTIKRHRELNDSEMIDLFSLVESNLVNEEILVGVYLLLGQHIAAESHYRKLSIQQQETFKTYPIYRFWA